MTLTREQLLAPFPGEPRPLQQSDGTILHTMSAGDGPVTVVLAHGFGSTLDAWNLIATDLVDNNVRVIAFDQRGHGRSTIGTDGITVDSMVSAYTEVLRAYAVEQAILVGHSMGGYLAMNFLLDRVDVATKHLAGCVLMATFAGDVSKQNTQNKLQIPLLKSGVLPRLLRFDWVATQFAKTLVGTPWNPAYAEGFMRDFQATDLSQLVPILEAFDQVSRYDELKQITLPCRIIVGSHDHTTPPFHTDELHKRIPNSTLSRLPNRGHLLNWEDPKAILNEIYALFPSNP